MKKGSGFYLAFCPKNISSVRRYKVHCERELYYLKGRGAACYGSRNVEFEHIMRRFDDTEIMVAEKSKLLIEREKYLLGLWYCMDPRSSYHTAQIL